MPALGATGAINGSSTGASGAVRPAGGGLLSRTGQFPLIGTGTMQAMPQGSVPMASVTATPQTPVAPADRGLFATYGRSGQTDQLSPALEPSLKTTTASLSAFTQTSTPTTVQTNSLKIVKVPVAGQPGQYITGYLPVSPQPLELPEYMRAKNGMGLWLKIVAVVMAVMLLGGGAAGTFWYIRSHQAATSAQITTNQQQPTGAPNRNVTATAQTQTLTDANVLLNDPLNQNTHNWLTSPPEVYAFKDGAYHITENHDLGRVTILQTNPFTAPLVYSLTMQEVKGDDGSINNSFGMIFDFTQKGNITTFYSFEVQNTKGGEYQLWKYDDTNGKNPKAWTAMWHQAFTSEFHYGHGANTSNTMKIAISTDHKFTFTVNGKVVKTLQDTALSSGMVGMVVNQDGTEVAFKNLLLTRS